MFTTRTVTHKFNNATGTPASGKIEFTLTQPMTNAGVTIIPSSLTVTLPATGSLSQALTCTDDAGTAPSPTGADAAQWRVDIRLQGLNSPISFLIAVPHGTGTIDLGTLMPTEPQVD